MWHLHNVPIILPQFCHAWALLCLIPISFVVFLMLFCVTHVTYTPLSPTGICSWKERTRPASPLLLNAQHWVRALDMGPGYSPVSETGVTQPRQPNAPAILCIWYTSGLFTIFHSSGPKFHPQDTCGLKGELFHWKRIGVKTQIFLDQKNSYLIRRP